MNPPELAIDERKQSLMMALLLTLAPRLAMVCRVFGLLLLVWLGCARLQAPLGDHAAGIGLVAAAIWAYSEWLFARICLDQSIFEGVATGKLTFAELDDALGRNSRPFAARRSGALGLLRQLAGERSSCFAWSLPGYYIESPPAASVFSKKRIFCRFLVMQPNYCSLITAA